MRSVKMKPDKRQQEKKTGTKANTMHGPFFSNGVSTNQIKSTIGQATQALDFHCLGDGTPGTGNIRGHQPNKRITR